MNIRSALYVAGHGLGRAGRGVISAALCYLLCAPVGALPARAADPAPAPNLIDPLASPPPDPLVYGLRQVHFGQVQVGELVYFGLTTMVIGLADLDFGVSPWRMFRFDIGGGGGGVEWAPNNRAVWIYGAHGGVTLWGPSAGWSVSAGGSWQTITTRVGLLESGAATAGPYLTVRVPVSRAAVISGEVEGTYGNPGQYQVQTCGGFTRGLWSASGCGGFHVQDPHRVIDVGLRFGENLKIGQLNQVVGAGFDGQNGAVTWYVGLSFRFGGGISPDGRARRERPRYAFSEASFPAPQSSSALSRDAANFKTSVLDRARDRRGGDLGEDAKNLYARLAVELQEIKRATPDPGPCQGLDVIDNALAYIEAGDLFALESFVPDPSQGDPPIAMCDTGNGIIRFAESYFPPNLIGDNQLKMLATDFLHELEHCLESKKNGIQRKNPEFSAFLVEAYIHDIWEPAGQIAVQVHCKLNEDMLTKVCKRSFLNKRYITQFNLNPGEAFGDPSCGALLCASNSSANYYDKVRKEQLCHDKDASHVVEQVQQVFETIPLLEPRRQN